MRRGSELAMRQRRHLVVVGCGMVGHRFVSTLTEHDREERYRLVMIGEEARPAYDRVQLTSYFEHRSADALLLERPEWYGARGITLRLAARASRIDRTRREVVTEAGEVVPYEVLVLATGSSPFVPPIPGTDKRGVFVYRTIEDLEAIVRYSADALGYGRRARVAVVGGGLLGLEAARAVLDAGLEAHVVEVAPRLMPRQLDTPGAALLERTIRSLGVEVHLDKRITGIRGDACVAGIDLADGARLEVDIVIFSAGIRPRDELARACGLEVGPRGGVIVDDQLRTSDPSVFAIGEVALHRGMLYGLVGPGYEMADVLAKNLVEQTSPIALFGGSDLSAKLKLLGTDVATFGDPWTETSTKAVIYEDQVRGTYKKLVLDADGRQLLGGILVGDAKDYGRLSHLTRAKTTLSNDLAELGLGGATPTSAALPDDAQICSCNGVRAGTIRLAVRDGSLSTLGEIKSCTRAGTGCGGCIPSVVDVLDEALIARGCAAPRTLCEHFAHTRQELFEIVATTGVRTFAELLAAHGTGSGCEICKPTIASILASTRNEPILAEDHRMLQDSNDRFLANIQRDGSYSVVPRVPAGEITADQLIAVGRTAKKYGLYAKITGGQRIDLFGARVEQLPDIWEELGAAGFESGHAYGKAMRTVKSCVGSTWCRYGVQDSTAFAIRIEHRYKGIRAPHKLKSAVSGCARECAEARSKDFGLIATEKGWNVYVCGNGGANPRHADLLVADADEDTVVRLLDRFIMFYIRTADRLTRTSVWLAKMEGGIDHLRDVVVNDSLGIAATLERDMQRLVDTYECEWAGVVRDPAKRAVFRQFANDATTASDGPSRTASGAALPSPKRSARRLHVLGASSNADPTRDPDAEPSHGLDGRRFVRLASVHDVPKNGGIAAVYGSTQIAIFNFASRGQWYAVQNMCPHTRAMVLARGIVGDAAGAPKVACPLHKKTFDLRSGACIEGEDLRIATFAVRIDGDDVLVELPPPEELATACGGARGDRSCAEKALAS